MPSETQSILINKAIFTKKQAIDWLKSRNFKHKKIHETADYYRFRQKEPTYKAYRTIKVYKGIKFVLGVN